MNNPTESFAESASILNNYLLREYGTTMSDITLQQWGILGGETPEELYRMADSWVIEKITKINMYHD